MPVPDDINKGNRGAKASTLFYKEQDMKRFLRSSRGGVAGFGFRCGLFVAVFALAFALTGCKQMQGLLGLGDEEEDKPQPGSEGGGVIFMSNPETSTGGGWMFDSESGVVTIEENGNYTITGNTTSNRVVVAVGVTAGITLNNVSIDVSGETDTCAFDITGATVKLVLASGSVNTLKSSGTAAGLQAPEGSKLTITSAAGAGSANGTLSAYGGLGTGEHSGAGIGGGQAQSGGTITIAGGTVNAYGFDDGATDNISNAGAGIGGGGFDKNAETPKAGDGGTITITGGVVTAVGGSSKTANGEGAAGIGGGSGNVEVANSGGTGGVILISGGTVTASTRINGAGIGGGYRGNSGSITISGGAVQATGGQFGAGIGGGYRGSGNNITIENKAIVNATGGDRCPGIGSGFHAGEGSAENITIYGVNYVGYGDGSGGNGQGSDISEPPAGPLHTITISNESRSVISTSGPNTRCAIGEGDY